MATANRHGADYFEIISFVSGSSEGKIYNVRHKDTGEQLTMHVISKPKEDSKTLDPSLHTENFKIPFVINLRYTFQTKSRNYFVLDTSKTERCLSRFYDSYSPFNMEAVTFLSAEILVAISELHAYHTTYNRLDLDNVLLDITGHVKLQRELSDPQNWVKCECLGCRRNGICRYHKEANIGQEAIAKDWIDFAVLFCFLLTGNVPEEMIEAGPEARCLASLLTQSILSENAAKLIESLLTWNQRPFTASQIQEHPFFENIDWQKVKKRRLTPPEIFVKTPPQFPSRTKESDVLQIKKTSSQKIPGERRIELSQGDSGKDSAENSVSSRSEGFLKLKGSINDYLKSYSGLVGEKISERGTLGVNGHDKADRHFHKEDTYFARASRDSQDKLCDSQQSFDVPNGILKHPSSRFNESGRLRPDSQTRLDRDDYCPDDVTFVTAESLEESFKNRTDSPRNSPSIQDGRTGRHRTDLSDNSMIGMMDRNWRSSDYLNKMSYPVRPLTPSMYGAKELRSEASSKLNAFCSAKSFDSTDIGYYVNSVVDSRSPKQQSLENSASNQLHRSSVPQQNKNHPLSSNEETTRDENGNITTGSSERAKIPVFTRSRSHHDGFSKSAGNSANEFNYRTAFDRANRLLESNFGNWRTVRFANDTSLLGNASHGSRSGLSQNEQVNLEDRGDKERNPVANSGSLNQRLSRSLINVSGATRESAGSRIPVRTEFKTASRSESKEKMKISETDSYNDEDSDNGFVNSYLTQSLPVEENCLSEEDFLKRTWPTGNGMLKTSAEIGKGNFSLMHRISDSDVLQKIKQGAFLQGNRHFNLPQRRNLPASNNDIAESMSSVSNYSDRVSSLRSSKSFNDLLSSSSTDPIEESMTFAATRPSEQMSWTPNSTDFQASPRSILAVNRYGANSSPRFDEAPRWAPGRRDSNQMPEYGESIGDDPGRSSNSIHESNGVNRPNSIAGGKFHSKGRDSGVCLSTSSTASQNFSPSFEENSTGFGIGRSEAAGYDLGQPGTDVHELERERMRLESEETAGDEKWIGMREGNIPGSFDGSVKAEEMSSPNFNQVTEEILEPEINEDDVFVSNDDDYDTLIQQPQQQEQKQQKLWQQGREQQQQQQQQQQKREHKSDRSIKRRNNHVTGATGRQGAHRELDSCMKKSKSLQDVRQRNTSTEPTNANRTSQSKSGNMSNLRAAKSIDFNLNHDDDDDDNDFVGHIGEKVKSRKQTKHTENVPSTDAKIIDSGRIKQISKHKKRENSASPNRRAEADAKNEKSRDTSTNHSTARSVSFHETTKTHNSPSRIPVSKSKSAGAIDSNRPRLSTASSSKMKEMKIEILPNPKTHRKSSQKHVNKVAELWPTSDKQIKESPKVTTPSLSVAEQRNCGVDASELVDRLRLISEANRSCRSSPKVDRRFNLKSSSSEIDRSNSVRKMLKPMITIENSTPRSNSIASINVEGSEKSFTKDVVSRESSIGSASDLWIEEDDKYTTRRKRNVCRRSSSATSGRSLESIDEIRTRYAPSPTLTNSSEDDINNRDADRQSYISGKSIDSGLSDIFETSKEDLDSISVPMRPRSRTIIAKSDSGVMKDINENQHSQIDDNVFEEFDQSGPVEEQKHMVLCHHCQKDVEESNLASENEQMCKRCHTKKVERKEAIVELIQTEINYGQDLRILKEEFYAPIKNGGILSTENVNAVFLNLQELIDVNSKLCITLQDDLEECISRDDQELASLDVGRVFLDNVEFFQAYEMFCSKQRQAVELVENLQKKSELLRIFLQVSCKQNSKLRKMDLKSFLTMPVQRIMKYPLLLTRIYRATIRTNSDRESLVFARRKIEEQITRINEIAVGRPNKLRKSKSTSALNQSTSESKGNTLTRLAAEILNWKQEETLIVFSDTLEVSTTELINISNWTRKSMKKSCAVETILCAHGVLEQMHGSLEKSGLQCEADFHSKCDATNAAVIILKRKSAHKYSLYKEPILLGEAVISQRDDVKMAFEISPIFKEPFTFLAGDEATCQKWLRNMNYYAKDLGLWRRRRNAKANIMIQSMS